MGRSYASELALFPTTYDWARRLDVATIASAIQRATDHPLASIGSGGSLSAAQFCADWHQHATGRLARAITPLEAVALSGALRRTAYSIFSARGKNRDIVQALAAATASDPPVTWVVCATERSSLEVAARMASNVVFLGENLPAGRDGFLATNSLLAFCVVMHRAYQEALGLSTDLPDSWRTFAGDAPATEGAKVEKIFTAQTVVVLHGYTTRAAAVDLESKCAEAALANVQLADFRNFAHGRHHWLAKWRNSSVLALIAPEDESLALKTLTLLPKSIPRTALKTTFGGMLGGLRALVDVMRLVEVAGRLRRIDPGRPGVPTFGSRLYSLRGIDLVCPPGTKRHEQASPAIRAIERKLQKPFRSLPLVEREGWLAAWSDMQRDLTSRRYAAIVFDYDGTLVDSEDRFNGPRAEVTEFLSWLLDRGVTIGIATGRGKSVGTELRACLQKRYWPQVVMGYYNGGDIAGLADAAAPDRREIVDETLLGALSAIRESARVTSLATITPRRPQITLEPRKPAHAREVWEAAAGALLRAGVSARMVISSHSVDVLAAGVSKTRVLDAIRVAADVPGDAFVLRIGDRAAVPGNDAELLCVDGISVDEVSSDPQSAWNIAPLGLRGVRATLALKPWMRITRDGVVRLEGPTDKRSTASTRHPAASAASPGTRRPRSGSDNE